jgi:hypothetical protein
MNIENASMAVFSTVPDGKILVIVAGEGPADRLIFVRQDGSYAIEPLPSAFVSQGEMSEAEFSDLLTHVETMRIPPNFKALTAPLARGFQECFARPGERLHRNFGMGNWGRDLGVIDANLICPHPSD